MELIKEYPLLAFFAFFVLGYGVMELVYFLTESSKTAQNFLLGDVDNND